MEKINLNLTQVRDRFDTAYTWVRVHRRTLAFQTTVLLAIIAAILIVMSVGAIIEAVVQAHQPFGIPARFGGVAEVEPEMNEHEFQSKLAELMTEISTLPVSERKKLEQLADETRARHERLKATVSSLQESLDYLRLSIKYLVFDLEATRRENGYLRKMLEETSGNE